MSGYDSNFIGVDIPLPGFTSELDASILRKSSSAFSDDGIWRKYIHYSVATNMTRRQPVCVALNIDQKLIKSVKHEKNWLVDDEIGSEYQLNNDYYEYNEWDRGHMARRATSAWGETEADARAAAEATYYYTNACLQHENLNRDEWLNVEDWVKDLELDSNDKISVFSGPIYGLPGVPKQVIGIPPTEIPAGFFKIVVFLDKEGKIATRAFIYPQDAKTLEDKRGSRLRNFTSFQVSTKEIEEMTGLIFAEILRISNPMKEGTSVPVNDSTEVINDPDNIPGLMLGDMSKIFIAAALINAPGRSERNAEWVSIANYSSEKVNLDGWTLSDSKRQPMQLSGSLVSGETIRLNPLESDDGGKLILANSGGVLTLKDSSGNIIDRVEWTSTKDGEVTVFNPP